MKEKFTLVDIMPFCFVCGENKQELTIYGSWTHLCCRDCWEKTKRED